MIRSTTPAEDRAQQLPRHCHAERGASGQHDQEDHPEIPPTFLVTAKPSRAFRSGLHGRMFIRGQMFLAKDAISDYRQNRSHPSNKKAAEALKKHFRWTEDLGKKGPPDVHAMVESVNDSVLNALANNLCVGCSNTPPRRSAQPRQRFPDRSGRSGTRSEGR